MTTGSLDAAIVGIGQTPFTKRSGRSEEELALEAVSRAIDDAGLVPTDVDGFVSYTVDGADEAALARNLGIHDLRFFARTPYTGGGAAATVALAAMAVATGAARSVVVYRALNGRSTKRYGTPKATRVRTLSDLAGRDPWHAAQGLVTPAASLSLHARRYMHDCDVTNEDFGRVSVSARSYAARNPAAWFYERPITLEDHHASRWIVEPVLRLLDCCQETDGAVAAVVTTLARANHLAQRPVRVVATSQVASGDSTITNSFYRPDLGTLPETEMMAATLWQQSGLSPSDMDVASLYDHFTPFVLLQLEAAGFCGRGEAKDFIADGHLDPGGALPTNTNGGQLGEGYIHGMNGILEAVRQVRRTSVNQVPEVEFAFVSSGMGGGVPTSGLILAAT